MTDDTWDEIVETRKSLRFIRGVPECPKCKSIRRMRYFNVTQKIYECTNCYTRLRIIE